MTEQSGYEAVRSICAEFDIKLTTSTFYPKAGETRSVVTLEKIRAQCGDGHLRLVLSTLLETGYEYVQLDEFTLWAVSDLVNACSDWIEKDLSSWYAAWESVPFNLIYSGLYTNPNLKKRRFLLAGAVYVMLIAFREDNAALNEFAGAQIHARMLEAAGMQKNWNGIRSRAALSLGRTLLAVQDRGLSGDLWQWAEDECQIPAEEAKGYVRLARQMDRTGNQSDAAPGLASTAH